MDKIKALKTPLRHFMRSKAPFSDGEVVLVESILNTVNSRIEGNYSYKTMANEDSLLGNTYTLTVKKTESILENPTTRERIIILPLPF